MKILNLYSGIGGNRKHWGDDHEITAVEYDQATADVYKEHFQKDTVLIEDAHEYLLNNYMNFDFIWSSPPCPSHSDIRRCGVHKGQYSALYPDMTLYQGIILLNHFAKKHTKYVVENVKPYYDPLIGPDKVLHRHLYWCNFLITDFEVESDRTHSQINGYSEIYGFDIRESKIKDKRKALRNMVDPDLGLHIFKCAQNIFEKPKTNQISIF